MQKILLTFSFTSLLFGVNMLPVYAQIKSIKQTEILNLNQDLTDNSNLIAQTNIASVFRPIFNEIKSQLQGNEVTRLPESLYLINNGNLNTFGDVLRQDNLLMISLNDQPNCEDSSCEVIGTISTIFEEVSLTESLGLSELSPSNYSYVDLRGGIVPLEALYVEQNFGYGTMIQIAWHQDRQTYHLLFLLNQNDDLSTKKEALINMARSMASQTPINSLFAESQLSNSQTNQLIQMNRIESIEGVNVGLGECEDDYQKLVQNKHFAIDCFNYQELNNGSRVFSFNVYNFGFGDGIIEVYNRENQLIAIRGINGIRNPDNVLTFPWESAHRLYRSFTEGYGFGDPRHSFGFSEKTEIINIFVPEGGKLIFTKTSQNAITYNQITTALSILFDLGLPEVFSENNYLEVQIISSLYLKFKEKQLESLIQNGTFINEPFTESAFDTSNWVDLVKLKEMMILTLEVLRDETPQLLYDSAVNQSIRQQTLNLIANKASILTKLAETLVKLGNIQLQWYNLDLAQRIETPAIIMPYNYTGQPRDVESGGGNSW